MSDEQKKQSVLELKLKTLAALNKALEENQIWAEATMDKLQALPEYQRLKKVEEEAKELKELIKNVRQDVQDRALRQYKLDGNKQPAPGVGIRVYKRLSYNPTVALHWSMTNLKTALKLDKKFFEKHAKAVQDTTPLDFVSYYEDPSATISSDLSEYLEG